MADTFSCTDVEIDKRPTLAAYEQQSQTIKELLEIVGALMARCEECASNSQVPGKPLCEGCEEITAWLTDRTKPTSQE